MFSTDDNYKRLKQWTLAQEINRIRTRVIPLEASGIAAKHGSKPYGEI
jgi:hypothetical protein